MRSDRLSRAPGGWCKRGGGCWGCEEVSGAHAGARVLAGARLLDGDRRIWSRNAPRAAKPFFLASPRQSEMRSFFPHASNIPPTIQAHTSTHDPGCGPAPRPPQGSRGTGHGPSNVWLRVRAGRPVRRPGHPGSLGQSDGTGCGAGGARHVRGEPTRVSWGGGGRPTRPAAPSPRHRAARSARSAPPSSGQRPARGVVSSRRAAPPLAPRLRAHPAAGPAHACPPPTRPRSPWGPSAGARPSGLRACWMRARRRWRWAATAGAQIAIWRSQAAAGCCLPASCCHAAACLGVWLCTVAAGSNVPGHSSRTHSMTPASRTVPRCPLAAWAPTCGTPPPPPPSPRPSVRTR